MDKNYTTMEKTETKQQLSLGRRMKIANQHNQLKQLIECLEETRTVPTLDGNTLAVYHGYIFPENIKALQAMELEVTPMEGESCAYAIHPANKIVLTPKELELSQKRLYAEDALKNSNAFGADVNALINQILSTDLPDVVKEGFIGHIKSKFSRDIDDESAFDYSNENECDCCCEGNCDGDCNICSKRADCYCCDDDDSCCYCTDYEKNLAFDESDPEADSCDDSDAEIAEDDPESNTASASEDDEGSVPLPYSV